MNLSEIPKLPTNLLVLERGWLSSNNILILGDQSATVIDTGYASHATQTVALVQAALKGKPLTAIINTHLHSDHAGGNAALQAAYPLAQTHIPPGQAAHVTQWDAAALFYTPTGQQCPPFRYDALLQPGSSLRLGMADWQVHAAPGHDPHSVVFFEPESRTLISADALWQNGFGVIFPELEGQAAFAAVAQTLDMIETLAPLTVIPGHGPVFGGAAAVGDALARARSRLAQFVSAPAKHARHGAKVLLKFKLLEWQVVPEAKLLAWAEATPFFAMLHQQYFAAEERGAWLQSLLTELEHSGALLRSDGLLRNQ
jgi:glyoxylase-like metal-dependent hydrolase (beta-lactamase superfamily II)